VDINKVYKALSKLKEINPLYHKINLPLSASELELDLAISEHTSAESNTTSEKMMIKTNLLLTVMTKQMMILLTKTQWLEK